MRRSGGRGIALIMVRLVVVSVCLSLVWNCCPFLTAQEKPKAAKPAWKELFDGESLEGWKSSQFGGEGKVAVEDGQIVMDQGSDMTGITWKGDPLPTMNYEVTVVARRIEGNDFFCGLTFQVKDDPCSLIIGGWGGSVVGISSLNGLDAVNNETMRYESFERGRWYTIRMRVTESGLMSWIDDRQVVGIATKDKTISIRPEVELSRPFGISCYATRAGLKEIKIRELTAEEAKAPITPPEAVKKPEKKK